MKLTTRLLVLLLPTAAVVMLVYALLALMERERIQVPKAELETRAFATALGLALGDAFPDLEQSDVQGVINQVSRDPRVYGVIIYGKDGQARYVSDPLTAPGLAPPEVLHRAIQAGETVSFQREIQDQLVLSVVRPITSADGVTVGALEVAQPLSFLEHELGLVRRRFLLNTITLLAAISLATLWLVRRVIGRPLEQMVEGARALGRGEFSHRISEDVRGGELAALAREFNAMAGNLEAARSDLIQEVEGRLVLERQLRQSEKMAEMGNLAAGLAHQIAAPLNVISGRAEMLLRNEGEVEVRERNLQVIIGQIGRITAIVRHLLDVARRRDPSMQSLDMVSLIDGVVELLEPELERHRVILVRGGGSTLRVSGDADLLHQVLVNLILNAVQAMDDGAGERRLTISTSEVRGDADGPNPGPEWAVVEVGDTGPGIPEAVRGRIFEPFFTTKSQGTGLGLMIVRTIVQAHGGTVETESSDQGTVFRFRLPMRLAREVAHS